MISKVEFKTGDMGRPVFPVPIFGEYDEDNVRTIKMEITPSIARILLTKNIGNRNVSEDYINEYAGRISRGEWWLNGAAIKIAWNGRLLDGQTRLEAVIKAGLPITTMVTYGLHPESQMTMDMGKKRSQADVLRMHGFTDTIRLAALINIVMRYKDGKLIPGHRAARYSEGQILDFANQNKTLLYNALSHSWTFNSKVPMAIVSAAAAAWYIMAEKNMQDLDSFWTRLITGEHQIDRDPVWVLRERIAKGAKLAGGGKGKLPSYLQVALTLKAFRYHIIGRPISYLRWDPETEPFPEVTVSVGDDDGFDSAEDQTNAVILNETDEFDIPDDTPRD
jgi:hypothetical protein